MFVAARGQFVTSRSNPQLLADLVTTAAMVDGNLIITKRDGTTLNVGNPGGIKRIFYTNESGPEPLLPLV